MFDGCILALNFLAPPTGDIYTLISAASITGNFSTVTGLPDRYSVDDTTNSILLIPSSTVPEAATLPLLMSIFFLLHRRPSDRHRSKP